ncbi:hypothetical protein T11_4015, partial [Trichinella zimbabwensis]
MKVLYLQQVEFTDFYIHIEQYAAVGLQQNTIDGKTEDKSYFNFYDIMYTHITTIQYLEIVKKTSTFIIHYPIAQFSSFVHN